MRRLAMFSFATLLAMSALAEEFLDCLSPEVRVMLLQFQGQRPPILTSLVPGELSALKLPREFTWIGSAERTQSNANANTSLSQVTAAWRSTLTPDAARASAAAALTAAGWEVWPMDTGLSVFEATTSPPQQIACREGRPVNVNVSSMDGVTYALIAMQRGNNNNSSCNRQAYANPLASSGMDKIVPRLEVPANPSTGAIARQRNGGSGSYGDGALTSQVQFSVKDSIGNVAGHFAKQMKAQGWSSDATWNGKATAGSTWLKRPDAKTVFQGTLSLAALDDDQYMATLRVLKLQ